MLKNKNIVLGVTGGIAAYKSPDIVSKLIKKGANVKVIMTESAENFITPLTLQTMSKNYVVSEMFKELPSWEVEHIEIAKKADIFLVAPASFNIIGKIANGIADDMLSTTIAATKAQVIFAPAMNTNMYQNNIIKDNILKLKKYGYKFIEPDSGRLACGDIGEGKLPKTEKIVEYLEETFYYQKYKNDFSGLKVIVTAGPTIEKIDPVRYISNNSSGKMGYEIAKSLVRRGAEVVLISGPVNLDIVEGAKTIKVTTTEEMFNAVEKNFNDADIIIKSAAPLDYRIKEYSKEKIKKKSDDFKIEMTRNKDILNHFGNMKRRNQIIVGFAAESENLVDNAKKKLINKNLDFIVANNIKGEETGFKSDYNLAKIIDKSGKEFDTGKITKEELANIILNKIIDTREA